MTATGTSVEGLVVIVATVVGLFVGSFLNVVVYRAPLGLSVSTPRSFCPTCDRQLEWWENVPLVSWVALRGRCHTCHERISVRYPLVEAATAVAFGLVARGWHGTWLTAGYCVLAATAISVGLIEFGGQRAPLSVAAIGTALGETLVVAAAVGLDRWSVLVWSLVGLVAATVLLGVLRARDPECRDPRGHGRTLLPVVGCWLGGLGGWAFGYAVAGMAAWILTVFACLVVVAASHREGIDDGSGRGGPVTVVVRVASVPLVSGILVALLVSLTIAG